MLGIYFQSDKSSVLASRLYLEPYPERTQSNSRTYSFFVKPTNISKAEVETGISKTQILKFKKKVSK